MNSERSSESTFRRVHAQTSPRSARAWSMRKPPACHWRAVPCATIIDFSLKRKGDGAAVMRTRRSKDQRAQAPHCFQHAGTATDRDDAFSRHSGQSGRRGAVGRVVSAFGAPEAHLCRWLGGLVYRQVLGAFLSQGRYFASAEPRGLRKASF